MDVGKIVLMRSEKLTSGLVCVFRWSQGRFRHSKERFRGFGKRCRAKELKTSSLHKAIDSMLLGLLRRSRNSMQVYVPSFKVRPRYFSLGFIFCSFRVQNTAGISNSILSSTVEKRRVYECVERYPFIVPSSLPWPLPFLFLGHRAQQLLRHFAAPRWLVRRLEPGGKRTKQRMLRVSRIRDQVSLRMRVSMAMPAEETVGDRRGGGWVHTCQGLSQSNPIGITPHHAPTIAPTTGYKRARSVSVRGLIQHQLV